MLQRVLNWVGKGPSAMILSGLFFAGMAAMVKRVAAEVPLFQVTFFRAVVSAILIGTIAYHRRIPVWGSNQKLLIGRAVFGFIAMALNFFAISKINLGDAAILNQSAPLFVMVISWTLLGERFYSGLLYLTLLSFLGISLILRPSGEVFRIGGLAGLGSGVFAALAYVAIRHLHKTDSFWTMAFYFMAGAALFSLLPMLWTWQTPTPRQLALLLGSGVFGTFGQLLMTYAYKHEEASWVAPFAYAGVVFSFVLGAVLFGEVPTIWTAAGASLTMAGGVGLLRLKRSIRLAAPTGLTGE